jgi:hypothetical protein
MRKELYRFLTIVALLAALVTIRLFRYNYRFTDGTWWCVDRISGRVWYLNTFANQWEEVTKKEVRESAP